MGSSGGGGFFGDVQRFFTTTFSPEAAAVQEELPKLEAENAAKATQALIAERDRKDKALGIRNEERAKQKAAASQGQGRGSTILTSPMADMNSIGGVGSSSMTGGKTLLGS